MAERSRPDRGAVTAELAVAMLGITVVLAAVLAMAQAVLAEVTCVDAARAAARAAARGDDLTAVRRAALDGAAGAARAVGAAGGRRVGSPATVDIAVADRTVTVTVTRPVRLLALGPAVRVSAHATGARELATGAVPA